MSDVNWARLTHAYGTAEDVPGLLRDLRSPSAVTREQALDALYGGVHHQGDVYDSTLACIPRLLAFAQDPDAPGRGPVIGLLTSIGASAEAAAEEVGEEAGDTVGGLEAVLAEATAGGPEAQEGEEREEGEDDEWSEDRAYALALLAGRALTAAVPSMVRLLADTEADVRAATAAFLVRCADDPEPLLPALTACVRTEPEPATRQECVRYLADLLGRVQDHDPARPAGADGAAEADREERVGRQNGRVRAAVDLLHQLATEQGAGSGADPATALTALTALAAHAPGMLPPDTADRALAALDRAGSRPVTPQEPGPDSGTMLSYLRDLRAAAHADDDGTEARLADAVQDLHGALGGRLHDRHRLVLHALRRTAPAVRRNTLDQVRELYGGWRVPEEDAAEAAAVLGTALTVYAGEVASASGQGAPAGPAAGTGPPVGEATAAAAARELRCCCLPLTDGILDAADRIADASCYDTGIGWEDDAAGECLQLLAAAGDGRGARHLGELLYGRTVPKALPDWCRRLGPHAAAVVPGLGARLEQAGMRMKEDPDDAHALRGAARLLAALQASGFAESADVVAPLLDALADRAEQQGTGLHPAGVLLLSAEGGLGPGAAAHTAVLRRLLTDRSSDARVGAARALWHATQDAADVLPVLTAAVEDTKDRSTAHTALDLAAVMGPAAAPLAPAVRACLDAPHDQVSTVARAALALRAITADHGGDLAAADAALLGVWAADRPVRAVVVAGLHRESTATPLPAGLPALLRAELADPRRLGNPGRPTGHRLRHDTATDRVFCARAGALLH